MEYNKTKKRQGGFTLVEVIVVAIIVAALAGVAVPMYTSYVKTSRSNAAANAAGSVASWMGQCLSQVGQVSATPAYNEGDETTGAAPITLKCKVSATDSSTMALPPKIKFKITKLTTNGVVEATHVDGSDKATYAY